jgi:hypothetical protein
MLHFVNRIVIISEVVDMVELQKVIVMPVYIWLTKW